jgi:RND superfamily putative drug exporter
VAARSQLSEVIVDSLPLVEVGTVALVALVVGLHFRSLGAPLLTLLAIGISYLTSIRLIAWIGEKLGISVPSEVEPVVVVLLFGVVTDYSVFFLSRVRRRMGGRGGAAVRGDTRRGGAPPDHRHRGADCRPRERLAGRRGAGLPQSLRAGHRHVDPARAGGRGDPRPRRAGHRWPRVILAAPAGAELPREEAAEQSTTEVRRRPGRSWALELATRRPLLSVAGCTLLLVAAASGLIRLDLGNPLIRGLPRDADAREAYRQASRGFAPGILSPTVVIAEGTGITSERRKLAALQELLERQPGVAEVVGPGDQPIRFDLGAALSTTGAAARYFVVSSSDPLGARAVRNFEQLRRQMPGLLEEVGLPRAGVLFAGDTALVAETIDKTVADLGRIAPTAIGVVLLSLALFLRALVAPLYLVAASLAALGAALGLTAYVFQGLAGYGELTYFVPVAAAVLLVSARLGLQHLPRGANLGPGAPECPPSGGGRSGRARLRRSPSRGSCWPPPSHC